MRSRITCDGITHIVKDWGRDYETFSKNHGRSKWGAAYQRTPSQPAYDHRGNCWRLPLPRYKEGAGALHAHIRDEDGNHLLDAGYYRELIDEMAIKVPDMEVQITTESVGRYDAPFQRHIVRAVQPTSASAGLRELLSDSHEMAATRFYHDMHEAGIDIQHILYGGEDVTLFQLSLVKGILPPVYHHLIFVLGRYTDGQQSHPDQLAPFSNSSQKQS